MIQKTLLLCLLVSCFSFSALSQTQKGRIQTGGAFSFDFTSLNEGSSTDFNLWLSGSGLYFLSNHFALGGNAGLNLNRININDEGDLGIGINGGITAAYYFGSGKAQPFVSASFNYGRTNNNASAPDFLYRSVYQSITLSPGYSIFIQDNMSIEISLPIFFSQSTTTFTNYFLDPSGGTFTSTSDYTRRSVGNRIGLTWYLK